MRGGAIAAAALLLAGCGSTSALERAEGTPPPPAAYGAAATPGTAGLLTPNVQARPQRTGEVLTRSQERKPDEFDLPPN